MLPRLALRMLLPAAVLASHGLAFACSGPGAMAAIHRAERWGWILLGINVVLVAGAVFLPGMRSRGWRKLWPLLLLVVVHPGWWLSARGGDCGRTRVEGSIVVTTLTLLVCAFLFWRARRAASQSAKPS